MKDTFWFGQLGSLETEQTSIDLSGLKLFPGLSGVDIKSNWDITCSSQIVEEGPAHNMAKFEMWRNDEKRCQQTCSIHSPDAAAEVGLKKIRPLMVY